MIALELEAGSAALMVQDPQEGPAAPFAVVIRSVLEAVAFHEPSGAIGFTRRDVDSWTGFIQWGGHETF
jgi:hypothetical protein